MGLFDSIGKIVGNVASGVGTFVNQASKFTQAIDPISTAVTAISGLFDSKDSGNQNPFGGGGSALGTYRPPPVPIETTTNTGAGPFAGGQSALGSIGALTNQGSGGSITPLPPFGNQNSAIETALSSIQAGNFLQPIGTGLSVLGKATGLFNKIPGFGINYKIPAIGDILGDDDNRSFGTNVVAPSLSNLITDYDISQATGDFMAYGVGGQGAVTMPQQMGSAFMSPVLGRIGISSRGNIIITRRLKNQFKALADNIGLAQAANLAGLPLEIAAMILTKRFSTRGKSISTKKMQECARTYKRITNFYNMIPRRTATRTTRAKSMRGASTVIQNS